MTELELEPWFVLCVFGKNCKNFMHNANLFGLNGVLSSCGARLFRILSIKVRRHGPEKACKGIATKHQSPTRS